LRREWYGRFPRGGVLSDAPLRTSRIGGTVALDFAELLRTTRRAAIVRGGLAATALTALAGLGVSPAEAKKKKKKKKKKSPPPQVIARLQASAMTGAKEIPGPGDPNATGTAIFEIKSNGQICCDFNVQNLADGSTIILTHIHQGDADEMGGVVVDFEGETENCVSPGQAILNQIIANPAGFYANLHTNLFSGGAVRDQLSEIV
jgi:hypothetical protein